MRKLAALFALAAPLVARTQEAAPAQPQAAPPPAEQYAPPPPQQYAPPPQQYAPPPQQYPPPPQQYPPPPQQQPPPPQGQPPPPQYAPPSPRYGPGAPPPYPPQPPRRQRGPWYIGFGFGFGDGRIKDGLGSRSFGDYFEPNTDPFAKVTDYANFSGEFQVGATLSPRLLLGFDWSFTGPIAKIGGLDVALSIHDFDAVATFFPVETGFFVRAGAGLSSYSYTLRRVGGGTGSKSHSGVNVIGGVGYAFWIGRSFNLTLNLDFTAQSYGGDSTQPYAPSSSSFWAGYLGFAWY